jgi:hypothetical protein
VGGEARPGRTERATPAGGPWLTASLVALGLGSAIFIFYFAAYPIRHEALPVGFDPPWYIWRARFVASQGVGPVQTSARPGHAILSAMLGPLTGLSQFELAVILSIVLVVTLALAIAALCRTGLGFDRGGWAVAIVIAGAVLGATRLLGENVANLLNTTFEVAAIVVMARVVSGEAGALWGAAALLVADGLTHWDFTALFGVVLVVAMALSLPATRRERALGTPLWRTEAGAIATAGGAAGATIALLIGPVLHAPLRTIDIPQNAAQWLPKIKTDLARMWAPAAAAVAGLFRLRRGEDDAAPLRRGFVVRMLTAWTAVMAGGTVFGVITSKAPAHRFFDLLVAVPGVVAAAGAVCWITASVKRRAIVGKRALLPAVVVAAIAVLALPAGFRWYRYPGLIQPALLQQAEAAGGYMERLPKGEPVIFLVDYSGGIGSYFAVPLKERTIRMAVTPDRQPDVYVVPGNLADLLSGRRTPAPDAAADRATRQYWTAVQPVLAMAPPIIALRAAGLAQFGDVLRMGAFAAPDVGVVRGPPGPDVLHSRYPMLPPVPRAVPPMALALLWFVAIMALLGAAGAGWTRVIFGPRLPPESYVCLAPVVGAAVMILGGLVAAKAGVRLGGPGGIATYATLTLAGFGAAALARRSGAPGGRRSNGSSRPFAEAPRPDRPGAST